MMTIQELAERIHQIAEANQASGIILWGGRKYLDHIAEVLGGDVIEVAPSSGCTSETCNHVSHDPAAPTYKWVPPAGTQLVWLGGKTEADEEIVEWYALFSDDTVHFLEVRDSRTYHGIAQIVDDVPEWALLELGKNGDGQGEGTH